MNKRTCEEIQNTLVAYLAAEETQTHSQIETHLATCAECSHVLRDIQNNLDQLSHAKEVTPRQNSWKKITQSINLTNPSTSKITSPIAASEKQFPLFLALATVLIITLCATFIWQIRQPFALLHEATLITKGNVLQQTKGHNSWQQSTKGFPLHIGDRLQTDDSSSVMLAIGLQIADIHLQNNSTLEWTAQNTVTLETGLAIFKIKPNKQAFTVATAFGICETQGAHFFVRSNASQLVVTVIDGTVSVTNSKGTTQVHSTQQTWATEQSAPRTPWLVDLDALKNGKAAQEISFTVELETPNKPYTLDSIVPLTITLRNNSKRIATLERFSKNKPVFFLEITDPRGKTFQSNYQSGPLSELGDATLLPDRITFKSQAMYVLGFPLTSVFSTAGNYSIKAVYQSHIKNAETMWTRRLESNSIRVQMIDP